MNLFPTGTRNLTVFVINHHWRQLFSFLFRLYITISLQSSSTCLLFVFYFLSIICLNNHAVQSTAFFLSHFFVTLGFTLTLAKEISLHLVSHRLWLLSLYLLIIGWAVCCFVSVWSSLEAGTLSYPASQGGYSGIWTHTQWILKEYF